MLKSLGKSIKQVMSLRSRQSGHVRHALEMQHNTAVLNIIEDSRKGFVRFVRPEGDRSAQVQVDVEWWYNLTREDNVRQLMLMNLLRDALNLSLHIDGQPLWDHDKPLPIVITSHTPVLTYYFWGECHVRVAQPAAPPQPLPEGEGL